MSERTDNPELEDEMTEATEPEVDEQEEVDEEWDDLAEGEEEQELPPRKRNRLMAPLSLALIAVFLFVTGLLAGVLVQQGSEEGSSGAGGLPSGLPSLLAEGGGAAAGGEGSGGVPSGFPGVDSDAAASGTVSSVDGHTIYVKESGGDTVAVKVEDGTKISRDANVSAKKIHPGDSVVVQGSKHGSKVKASSISATESGVESSAAAGLPTAGGGEGEDAEGGGSIELFGE